MPSGMPHIRDGQPVLAAALDDAEEMQALGLEDLAASQKRCGS
jgi:hypothetical protein